ncbi:MAG: NAD-dependent epimerase/dehydratase family protein, partial [Alphaproteobacteria bacterium]|nr:NAD-dependent epimerase/dehydratase family protein [Alphaproteobacteria bacterium]
PIRAHEVDATGSLYVCQAALHNKVERLLYVSTGEVYGSALYYPLDEKHPMRPTNVYGAAKAAGDYKQAVVYAKKLLMITFVTMISVNLPILLFSPQVIGLFSLSPDASEIAVRVLPSLAISCCLVWPLSFAFPNVLRAAGDARYTMIVSALTMWVVRFGLSYLLIKQFHFGLEGVWYCMMIDWVVRSVFFVFRYRGGRWKTKTVLR